MRCISHFSLWICLKRMVGWFLRFKALLLELAQRWKQLTAILARSGLEEKQLEQKLQEEMQTVKAKTARGCLSVEEFDRAETAIICFCQRWKFLDEITSLQCNNSKGESVKKSSHLYKLDPILDEGVLRVGSRLSRAAMPDKARHPAKLAKHLHISDLVLHYIHQKTGHGGNHMLSDLQQRSWILGASVAITKTLSKCMVCRKCIGLSLCARHQVFSRV